MTIRWRTFKSDGEDGENEVDPPWYSGLLRENALPTFNGESVPTSGSSQTRYDTAVAMFRNIVTAEIYAFRMPPPPKLIAVRRRLLQMASDE